MAGADVTRAIAAGRDGAIPEQVLAGWVTHQRWFGSKARDVAEFHVLDVITLREGQPLLAIVILEARFRAGTHELYQVPLGVRPAADGRGEGVVWATDDVVVYDALTDPEQAAVLAGLMERSAAIDRPAGCVRFSWDERGGQLRERPDIRPIGAEQSNSSVVFDDRLVLKVFRRIEPGTNPELEMLRFLAGHGFENIAALTGWYGYTGDLMDATLGIMQQYIAGGRDGWELTLDALSASDAPARAEDLLAKLEELGRVTGRMHATLASDPSNPAFAAEEPTDETVSLLTATIDEQIERVFVEVPPDNPDLDPIRGRGEEVRDLLQNLSHTGVGGRLIRHHGDYHLGQTLHSHDRWVILDFEGEPGRPLIERRRKRSALRDVAGMLRSFAYAASATRLLRGSEPPADWEARARERFLEGYMADTDASLLPAGQISVEKLLAIFELEKAIYELRYELNNRPEWVPVPVAGIVRLLESEQT